MTINAKVAANVVPLFSDKSGNVQAPKPRNESRIRIVRMISQTTA